MLINKFTNYLIGLSIDQMLIPKIEYWLKNSLFHYWWNVKDGLYHYDKNASQKLESS